MSRLPTINGDNANWGVVLNDFLSQAHNADGTLKFITTTGGIVGQVLALNGSGVFNPVTVSGSGGGTTYAGGIPGQVLAWNGATYAATTVSGSSAPVKQPIEFTMAGNLIVLTGSRKFPITASGITVLGTMATVGTAPQGLPIILDVKKNGTTIYSTQGNRPTIQPSGTISAFMVPDITSTLMGDVFSVDIAQVGNVSAGADLTTIVLMQG